MTPSAPHDPVGAPRPLVLEHARAEIRRLRAEAGRRIAVLDDDPTGSQTVHAVEVVTVLDEAEYAAALADPGSTAFILTNTRSLAEHSAVEVTGDVAHALFRLGERQGFPVDVVSRSDSTLRGHVLAEVRAIDAAQRSVTGSGFDGILLAPGYFDAGRVTSGDVHWARDGDALVPVGETEFATDATFGYRSSDLKEFLSEKSGGSVASHEVRSIGLEDIRVGGPERVTQILEDVSDGAFVVVNGTEYSDYEIVVLGLLRAEAAGKTFLHRTGPSFVRALAGIEPRAPLTAADIWPSGGPSGHGLIVIGSHVGLTSRQVGAAQQRCGVPDVELDVPTLLDPQRRDEHIAEVGARLAEALRLSSVMLFTSRAVRQGSDADDSLAISRSVSSAVVEVVRAALPARPGWVLAKGGITSHDVAVHGLGIRRAQVLGQLFPGVVSVLEPVEAAAGAVGVPYVVFAGNVGDENTLADIIESFSQGS